MEFGELVKALSEELGFGVENVDDAVAFDVRGMPFFLMRVANEGECEYLVMAADLGELPPERPEKLYQALLDAGHNYNVAGGGTFSRSSLDGHIWLQWRDALPPLDAETVMAKMKTLGEAAVNWKNIITDYREAEPSAGSPPPFPVGGGGAGFMLV